MIALEHRSEGEEDVKVNPKNMKVSTTPATAKSIIQRYHVRRHPSDNKASRSIARRVPIRRIFECCKKRYEVGMEQGPALNDNKL